MSQSRLEWKVGLFVAFCLALVGALLLNFAKGVSILHPTYELKLRTANVGGIKRDAAVLMAGVPVGQVREVKLDDDGKQVTIFLRILKRYVIYGDAIFNIEAAGFLGDQYVAIISDKNLKPPLRDGDVVVCREPFNMQEAARAAFGVIQRVDQTVLLIHDAVARVDRTILSENNLTNISTTFANFKGVSEQTRAVADKALVLAVKAEGSLDRVDALIATNTQPVNAAVSNLLAFSRNLENLATDLREVVATNRGDINAAVRNLETSSSIVTNLLADLQAGKGLAGGLLKDDVMRQDFTVLLRNLNMVSTNLVTLSSNLTRFGLLYKPKPVKTNTAPLPGNRPDRYLSR